MVANVKYSKRISLLVSDVKIWTDPLCLSIVCRSLEILRELQIHINPGLWLLVLPLYSVHLET